MGLGFPLLGAIWSVLGRGINSPSNFTQNPRCLKPNFLHQTQHFPPTRSFGSLRKGGFGRVPSYSEPARNQLGGIPRKSKINQTLRSLVGLGWILYIWIILSRPAHELFGRLGLPGCFFCKKLFFFKISPRFFWGDDPVWLAHVCSMGWRFNHQLESGIFPTIKNSSWNLFFPFDLILSLYVLILLPSSGIIILPTRTSCMIFERTPSKWPFICCIVWSPKFVAFNDPGSFPQINQLFFLGSWCHGLIPSSWASSFHPLCPKFHVAILAQASLGSQNTFARGRKKQKETTKKQERTERNNKETGKNRAKQQRNRKEPSETTKKQERTERKYEKCKMQRQQTNKIILNPRAFSASVERYCY